MTLIFDFDSTLLSCEGLDLLAKLKAIPEENLQKIEEITNQGMEGKIDLKESLNMRLALMSFTKSEITSFIPKYLELISTSVLRNINFFKNANLNLYVVSGGFTDYVVPVSEFIGFDKGKIFANKFIFKDDEFDKIDETIPLCENGGKPKLLGKLNLKKPIIMIGDGSTDYEVKSEGVADFFIAYIENISRDSVVKNADFVAENMEEVIEIIQKIS